VTEPGNSWLKHHRLIAFYVLAFLLSWYPWLLALLRHTTSGPNPLGPFVAAIVITAATEGKTGLGVFFRRLIRCRFGIQWYLLVLLVPPLICVLAATITIGLAGSRQQTLRLPTPHEWSDSVDRFILIFFFIALGEEPGWRGFALPHLQKTFSPLQASFLLAPVWAFWHLPLIGNEFPWPIVPAFVISVFGGTLFQTWLFNRTNESVLIEMILHAVVNTVGAGLLFPQFKGTPLVVLWSIYAILWFAAGLSVLIFSSDRRTRQQLN